jgi:hypothetical protein
MTVIKGIFRNGQIIPMEPMNWPDGTEVRIEPIGRSVAHERRDQQAVGLSEENQEDSPEAIAEWIAEFDAIPPLEMSPEEEAEWQAAREAQKALEINTFRERADKLRGLAE